MVKAMRGKKCSEETSLEYFPPSAATVGDGGKIVLRKRYVPRQSPFHTSRLVLFMVYLFASRVKGEPLAFIARDLLSPALIIRFIVLYY